MDATGDFDSLGDVTSAEQLKVRESSVFGSWDLLTLTGFAGFRVVVKKVSFSDGTTWESGEDINRCVYAEDHRTK